jgi:hypothetical protein
MLPENQELVAVKVCKFFHSNTSNYINIPQKIISPFDDNVLLLVKYYKTSSKDRIGKKKLIIEIEEYMVR